MSLRVTEMDVSITWLNICHFIFSIHLKFVTNFHVCNLHFVRSMTSMHISLNACISDKIEQKKLFAMVSEQK